MTRSLTALRIGNFKAFADTQRIPLKPITLIFGPNSAGKSSIIQALAFAHQAQLGGTKARESSLDVHATDLGGSAIDLGGFKQFTHRGDLTRRVEWGVELEVAALPAQLRQLLVGTKEVSVNFTFGIETDDMGRAKKGAAARIEALLISFGPDQILQLSRRSEAGSDTVLRLDRAGLPTGVSNALAMLASTHRKLWQARQWPSDQYFVDLLTKVMSSPAIFDKEKIVEAVQLLGGMEQISDAINENSGFELSVLISNLLPATVRLGEDERRQNEDLRKQLATGNDLDSISFAQIWAVCAPVFIREIVLGLSHALADDLQRLRYLGPNRMAPDRHMIFSESGDGASHADGALAWDILMHHSEVRERVNQWLGGHPGLTSQQVAKAVLSGEREGRYDKWMKTPYRLFVDRHISIAEFRDALAAAFYERPLTLMERRELLTKDLATVFAALQQQYDTDQWRAEEYAKELRPWIERIQKAKSPADREQLIQEALAHFEEVEASKLQSPGVQWETEDEDLDEEAPLERAQARADQFIDSLDRRGVTGIAELRLRDINKQTAVSISDVGFGISQVLPVLTLAYGSHNNIIAIEQPEIHLHPELQAELADVFIESALGGHQNTFLLETHSEHLILRVMKRMRETWHKKESTRPPISPKDVAILYVEPLGTRSVVREIPLNDAGQLVKAWPGGFFEEGLKEQLDNA